jgi:1,4-dihydroxy-2-naphthoyl-CoA hydrolase
MRSSPRSYAGWVTDDPSTLIEPLPSGAAVEYIRESVDYKIYELSGTRVRATLSLNEAHHQPFGRVHGGIYAIAVEGVASAGACAAVAERGMYAVGTHNSTDFLRPVAVADVEVVAEPIFQGRTQQLWEVSIARIEDGKLVAVGRLRLQNLPLPEGSAIR